MKFTFSKRECAFRELRLGLQVQFGENRGLFSKFTCERVSANGGRWIKIGRSGTDGRERERGAGAGTVRSVARRHCRRRGLAGARGIGDRGHGFHNRRHWEMAGVKGNPPRPIRRSEGSAEMAVAMVGGRKLVGARKTGSTGHEMRNKLHGER